MSQKVMEIVIKAIKASLDKGIIPWSKPWALAGNYNGISGKAYTGFNQMALATIAMNEGFKSTCWLTLKQVKDLGGRVQDDQFLNSAPILWAFITEEEDETTGKTTKKFKGMRFYSVYNLDQLDPTDEPLKVKPAPDLQYCGTADILAEQEEAADALVDGMPNPPDICHTNQDRACYVPALDLINIPNMEHFKTVSAYYHTLFHELVHSTGHASRCNRPEVTNTARFGSEIYSKEELTAEVGSAMLCHMTGLPWDVDNTAAYIASWRKHLDANAGDLVAAANRAGKAVEYMTSVS